MSLLLKETRMIRLEESKLNEMREMDAAGKPVVVVGIIQRSDEKNQNGRIYPHEILKKEMERYKLESVDIGNALGQLDHIDNPVIELANVSHILDEIWHDGPGEKEVWGKVRLLPTPKGDIAKSIVLQGIPLGISSRAVGSVESRGGCDYVKDDLNMIAFDLVGTPSTRGSFLSIQEAKRIYSFAPRKVLPAQYRIKNTLRDLLGK